MVFVSSLPAIRLLTPGQPPAAGVERSSGAPVAAETGKRSAVPPPAGGQQRLLEALQQRDREVRSREAVLAASNAALRSGAFTYERGPDGRMYAIDGEVTVDTSAAKPRRQEAPPHELADASERSSKAPDRGGAVADRPSAAPIQTPARRNISADSPVGPIHTTREASAYARLALALYEINQTSAADRIPALIDVFA